MEGDVEEKQPKYEVREVFSKPEEGSSVIESEGKPLKWAYELTDEELKTYPLNRIKVAYDRLDNKWITVDDIKDMRFYEG